MFNKTVHHNNIRICFDRLFDLFVSDNENDDVEAMLYYSELPLNTQASLAAAVYKVVQNNPHDQLATMVYDQVIRERECFDNPVDGETV